MATNPTLPADKTALFTKKAKKYFVCFADQCPLHATCLRWEVGQYVDADEEAIMSMNPSNKVGVIYRCFATLDCIFR